MSELASFCQTTGPRPNQSNRPGKNTFGALEAPVNRAVASQGQLHPPALTVLLSLQLLDHVFQGPPWIPPGAEKLHDALGVSSIAMPSKARTQRGINSSSTGGRRALACQEFTGFQVFDVNTLIIITILQANIFAYLLRLHYWSSLCFPASLETFKHVYSFLCLTPPLCFASTKPARTGSLTLSTTTDPSSTQQQRHPVSPHSSSHL